MATFCETLAETAVVAEACDAARMGISGAYAARRRNPVFAAAWDAALTIARERLADTLLARSMEGNVEQIWRDGALVGERHLIDNRMASPSSAASTGSPRWAWRSARSASMSPSNIVLEPPPPVTLTPSTGLLRWMRFAPATTRPSPRRCR